MTKPIDRGVFEYHAGVFADAMGDATYSTAATMRRSIEEAQLALAKLEAFRTRTLADDKLSPTGKQQALREWAESQLPELRKRVETIAAEVSATEANALNSIMADLIEGPTELADVALTQEIRTYLRSVPEGERADLIRKLVAKGDREPQAWMRECREGAQRCDPRNRGDRCTLVSATCGPGSPVVFRT